MPFPYTIADIEAAAERTGLKVMSGGWCGNPGEHCGCPLYILAFDRDPSAVRQAVDGGCVDLLSIGRVLGLRSDRMNAFTDGFDGDVDSPERSYDPESYDAGAAAREHFLAKGVLTP